MKESDLFKQLNFGSKTEDWKEKLDILESEPHPQPLSSNWRGEENGEKFQLQFVQEQDLAQVIR
ncbi:MAG: hypothetical protein WCK42_08055, partial [Myxococcaceae bacterium]